MPPILTGGAARRGVPIWRAGKMKGMTELKTITYRGGIAKFRIPSTWVEEYEPSGGGTFYENGPDTGTLRINVLDFEKAAGDSQVQTSARDILASSKDVDDVEQLPNGNASARSRRTTVENGEELLIYTLRIGVMVAPTCFRLVVFSYTILASQDQQPATQMEIQLLDKLLVEGEYPAIQGETGDFLHKP